MHSSRRNSEHACCSSCAVTAATSSRFTFCWERWCGMGAPPIYPVDAMSPRSDHSQRWAIPHYTTPHWVRALGSGERRVAPIWSDTREGTPAIRRWLSEPATQKDRQLRCPTTRIGLLGQQTGEIVRPIRLGLHDVAALAPTADRSMKPAT